MRSWIFIIIIIILERKNIIFIIIIIFKIIILNIIIIIIIIIIIQIFYIAPNAVHVIFKFFVIKITRTYSFIKFNKLFKINKSRINVFEIQKTIKHKIKLIINFIFIFYSNYT